MEHFEKSIIPVIESVYPSFTPLDDAALSDAVSEAGFTLTGISRDF